MHCSRILHRRPVLPEIWVFALVFILYPFVSLLISAIKPGAGHPGGELGCVLTSIPTWEAVTTSVVMAAVTTIFTLACALVLALLVVRTDMPKRQWVNFILLISFSIPSYVLALSWIQLTSRNGYVNRLLDLFDCRPLPFSPYSQFSVGLVLGLHMLPIAYFALSNALSRSDENLEYASLLSGASPLKTLFTVTIPMVFPQLLSIGMLIFARVLANFDVPAALALPIGKQFLPTRIYASLSALNLGEAAGLSLVLMALSVFVQSFGKKRFQQRRYEVHTQGTSVKRISLGPWRWVLCLLVFLFLCALLIPFLSLFVSSFLKRWGLPLQREYFTFSNYTALFSSFEAKKAVVNSIFYGSIATVVAVLVSVQVVYKRDGQKGKRNLLRVLSLPMATPNIVLAVAAIMAWNNGFLPLYGTKWAIIATYSILFVPLILQNIRGLAATNELDQVMAARVCGASERKSNHDIAWPILVPGVQSGALLCFIIALREIPISLLLYSSGQETIGVLLFGMQSQSYGMEMTSTLAVLVTVSILVLRSILNHGSSTGTSQ